MFEFTQKDLNVMSRALELAFAALPNKPRADVTTADLADAIISEAADGLRCEISLAERALERVLAHQTT